MCFFKLDSGRSMLFGGTVSNPVQPATSGDLVNVFNNREKCWNISAKIQFNLHQLNWTNVVRTMQVILP